MKKLLSSETKQWQIRKTKETKALLCKTSVMQALMKAFGEIDHGWSQHLREYNKCRHRSFAHITCIQTTHTHTNDVYYSLGMRVHVPSELTCFMVVAPVASLGSNIRPTNCPSSISFVLKLCKNGLRQRYTNLCVSACGEL